MTDDRPGRGLATRLAVTVAALLISAAVFVGIVVSNTTRISRNTSILREICDASRRQNAVLVEYGAILTDPIPIPPDAGPALATAITNRNRAFANAAEFARNHAKTFSCPGVGR